MRCITCEHGKIIEWTKEKDAIQCGADSPRKGWAATLYPKGKRRIAEQTQAPAWCPAEERAPKQKVILLDPAGKARSETVSEPLYEALVKILGVGISEYDTEVLPEEYKIYAGWGGVENKLAGMLHGETAMVSPIRGPAVLLKREPREDRSVIVGLEQAEVEKLLPSLNYMAATAKKRRKKK